MAPLRADTTTAATTTTTTTTTTDSNYIPHSYHDQDEEHEDVYDYEDDEHLAAGCEHVDRTGIVRVGATKLNGGEAIRHYQPGKGPCMAIIVKNRWIVCSTNPVPILCYPQEAEITTRGCVRRPAAGRGAGR